MTLPKTPERRRIYFSPKSLGPGDWEDVHNFFSSGLPKTPKNLSDFCREKSIPFADGELQGFLTLLRRWGAYTPDGKNSGLFLDTQNSANDDADPSHDALPINENQRLCLQGIIEMYKGQKSFPEIRRMIDDNHIPVSQAILESL